MGRHTETHSSVLLSNKRPHDTCNKKEFALHRSVNVSFRPCNLHTTQSAAPSMDCVLLLAQQSREMKQMTLFFFPPANLHCCSMPRCLSLPFVFLVKVYTGKNVLFKLQTRFHAIRNHAVCNVCSRWPHHPALATCWKPVRVLVFCIAALSQPVALDPCRFVVCLFF